ncbi:hypothetical protein [Bosea vestrisii]|uniref:Uncharacterized protein n=1 Tax=Bosea vestrisii TaxID=151416 RepID=A0ABW0H5Z2_9HYPH
MTSKTKHAATLAALLMSESADVAVTKAALIKRTGDGYDGKDTEAAIAAALKAQTLHPEVAAADALALIRIGAGVARWAVRACNGEGRERVHYGNGQWGNKWDDADTAAHDKADERALAKLQAIADRYGATVKIGGDPRGYVVKLILASGRHNTWGGASDGWGVA